jgi:hypothetical protein
MQNTPHDPHGRHPQAQGTTLHDPKRPADNGFPGHSEHYSPGVDSPASTATSAPDRDGDAGQSLRRDEQGMAQRYSHIPGWGIDADPSNDPTLPMRHRSQDDPQGYSWDRPEQQTMRMEINHSVERPHVTAVFGTAVPPSGVSGMIRRMAFRKTENQYSHWLPLLLADRVNMVEGILQDFAQGRLPHYFEEKGLSADWKYRRPRLLANMAIAGAVVLGTASCLARHSRAGRRASAQIQRRRSR